MHRPDQDRDAGRPANRFRLTGKAPPGKRLHPETGAVFPTLKRWKRLILPESVEPVMRFVRRPAFFLASRLAEIRASDAWDHCRRKLRGAFSHLVALAASAALPLLPPELTAYALSG